jgi:hypothetical protein
MKYKPLVFRILSIFFMIEPLIKVLYFKALTHFDFNQIFDNLFSHHSLRDIFDFWLVFPLAGLMLLRLRKWTYFGFLALIGYLFFSIMTYERYTWPYNSSSPLFYHYGVVFFAIAIFTYFLIPEVREPFFNRKLRWWETKPRYQALIPGTLSVRNLTFETQILDISVTGAFVKDSDLLVLGDTYQLQFEYQGISIQVPVEVVSKHMINKQIGYGIHFRPLSIVQKLRIYKTVQRLRKSES